MYEGIRAGSIDALLKEHEEQQKNGRRESKFANGSTTLILEANPTNGGERKAAGKAADAEMFLVTKSQEDFDCCSFSNI